MKKSLQDRLVNYKFYYSQNFIGGLDMRIATLLVLSMFVVPAFAQISVISAQSVSIRSYVILGKGIAASPTDPMDFMIVKFGLGKVRYAINDTEAMIGVLKLDDESYRLREVVVEDSKATGKIYSNSSEVGSFEVSSVMKGDIEMWAGTMTLGSTYNLYVMEGVRPVRASELNEKVVEYCNTAEDANCRDRLGNYCENNPEDTRCRALFRAYCLKDDNMDDTRCREEFRNWCSENPTNANCIPFELQRAKSYCEENSGSNLCNAIATKVANFCANNTENIGCGRVKEMVQAAPTLLKNAQALRTRITNLRTTAVAATAVKSADLMAASGAS